MPAHPARRAVHDHAKTPQPGEAEFARRRSENWSPSPGRRGRRARAAAQRRRARGCSRSRCAMLGDADEAEDAVQEAMVKVWRHLGRFEGRVVVHDLAPSHRGQRGARSAASPRGGPRAERRRPTNPATTPPSRRSPEDARADLRAAPRPGRGPARARRACPNTHGEALRLCDLEGESYADDRVARPRCPLGTVMSRLYHARRKLAASSRKPPPAMAIWPPCARREGSARSRRQGPDPASASSSRADLTRPARPCDVPKRLTPEA